MFYYEKWERVIKLISWAVKRPFGNLGIGISASASVFQYIYSFLHSINSLKSNKLVLFIFFKHVISIIFANYRLEASDFVRKCFAKISRRKSSDNLKRVTVKNPYRKTSALESHFNEIAGINSRLASFVKAPTKHIYLWIY